MVRHLLDVSKRIENICKKDALNILKIFWATSKSYGLLEREVIEFGEETWLC